MLWLGKKKNNRNTCSVFLDEIKYVAKYGTKKTNGVVGFKRGYSKLSGIDNTSFPSDCNLIEIYKQNSKYSEVKEVEINESMLEFHIRLFRGDFIPALQAVQLDASQTSVKPEHKERYNKLVKQIVEQGADGIITVDGYPYLASAKDTYYFELDSTGKVAQIASLDSLYISAEAKYEEILQGSKYISSEMEINNRTLHPMGSFSEIVKK